MILEVTLCPLDREMNDRIERQPRLTWQTKTIRSSEGIPVVISYAEICTVQLEQFDSTYKRLLLNSTLCQLEFRLKISVRVERRIGSERKGNALLDEKSGI